MSTPKVIILDRDGVINYDSPAYIKSPAEWQAIPGSLEAVARFSQAGWLVAIASNQSGVERGLFSLDTLARIHAKMLAQIVAHGGEVNALVYCPHAPEAQCACRKPAPGMLREIMSRLGIPLAIPLANVMMVGDSLKDLQAARAVDVTPILVKTGKGMETLSKLAGTELATSAVYADLAAVADALLSSV